MRNSFICMLLLSFCSCATYVEKNSEKGESPLSKLFTKVDGGDITLLKTELKPNSLSLDCTKRRDQPYYWCGLDGNFRFPHPGLPEAMEAIFHVQLPLKSVKKIERLVENNFKKSDHFTIVIHQNPQIDYKQNRVWNQLFAFYDDHKCVAFLGRADLCPKMTTVLDIY